MIQPNRIGMFTLNRNKITESKNTEENNHKN
jgi:hypothetical protein